MSHDYELTSNLLEDTIVALKDHGYTAEDIEAVAGGDWQISVPKFLELAGKTEYDPGYGMAEICEDLVLLMKDGAWYSRREYDGSEWWAFNRRPDIAAFPNRDADIKQLKGNPFKGKKQS